MARDHELRDRIALIARELAAEFGEMDDSDALSMLDAIESRAVEIGDAVARELVKQKLSDRPVEENEAICAKCGQLGRYQGARDRPLVTRRGPMTISEPEYFCPCCRKAFFPDDPCDRR
jgi:hypothetical protein